MISTVSLSCHQCGKPFDRSMAENRRQVARGRMPFCSISCSAKHGNSIRGNRRVPIKKTCAYCNAEFETMTGFHEADFCSRGCASSGGMTEYRIMRAKETGRKNVENFTFDNRAIGMKKRESWRYEPLIPILESIGCKFEFEYPIEPYIFDLSIQIEDKRILIEFDGREHLGGKRRLEDLKKQAHAESLGWTVIHIPVQVNTAIQPELILPFCQLAG